MKKLTLTLVLLIAIVNAYAQGVAVYGTVLSGKDTTALPGAAVMLQGAAGSNTGGAADVDGKFRVERVSPGQYTVIINYLGFKPYNRTIQVQNQSLNLGKILLEDASATLGEVQVIGRAPLGEQKGDTTQFNAKAFKTAPDASAEDLVTKMPGVTIENGTVQAQGEEVRQIMIDGKRYGGDDVSSALRNLPADAIESVQVYDRQSDQAAFSGFDDGNRAKTLNFVTRKDRRQGHMGKVSAGYGTDDRYMVGAALNIFNNDRKITITGLTNNINMFDFSIGETPGGGMRGRRGGWGGGSPNGIISTNTLSANYNDVWGKKIDVSSNYSYNNRDIVNNQYKFREYTSGLNAGDVLTENSLNNNTEDNHRLNFRLQYNINENNRLLVTPSISLQQNTSTIFREAITANEAGDQLATSINSNTTDSKSFNFNNNILYSHRFGKPGRVFTTNFNTSYSSSDNNRYERESTLDLVDPNRNVTRNQFNDIERNNLAWSGNASISERVGENALLQLEYNIGNQVNDSDKLAYDFDENTQSYNELNVPLSNSFESTYLSQSVGPSYQYRTDKTRLQLNARYQYATLTSNAQFPEVYNIKRNFSNVLPSAELEYKFSQSQSLNINFRTGTNVPSAEQLQEVLDISNPLQVSIGNPDLDQDYQNRLFMRFRSFNPETNRVFFLGVFGTMTDNFIANSVYSGDNVPAELIEGYTLRTGARLYRPVNLDGYWNVRSFFNYGQPINFISSNINFNGSIGYSRTPGLIDDVLNYANTTNLGLGVNLSSNISEKVDFNISTNGNYNIVKNTSNQALQNNNYFTQNSNARLSWILWKDLVYRTELNHQFNSGLSSGVDASYLLWNMSVGKKFLKSKKAEVSFSVNDLLKQNVSIQRNVTESFVEDVQSTVLQRFFMLTLTYNIRNYNGEMPAQNGGWGGPGRPPR
ncbi:TonB-dependent receptor [Pontibacter harenae]|uniref:TonB-dependent receptor n=1 Tax=Pontibacter harenae TaxID=2894083 RepID=UPI001E4EF856|nr:TonB-dependent receptor [Pontibacter harenae]MCC9165630.1 TonB-dependent receptor family protein [Pontibacter harenae]